MTYNVFGWMLNLAQSINQKLRLIFSSHEGSKAVVSKFSTVLKVTDVDRKTLVCFWLQCASFEQAQQSACYYFYVTICLN